ncbi:hypothetical protein [Pseudolysinimonas kribbensis]|uniref:hypothetical protein n=1 Tax=Pseudolysinimonas kribbensis TaxID=433641 RepID=UPI0024E156CD|nr:hypothetical protein [Pseudolysinimonas kribbensis]
MTTSGGAFVFSCGSASSVPGTRMNPYDRMLESSGWVTENGMIWLFAPTFTRMSPPGCTSAPPA